MKRLMVAAMAVVPLGFALFAEIPSMKGSLPTALWTRRWWLPRFDEKKALAEREEFQVAFIGDSITHGWESRGAAVWTNNFASGKYRAINFGFGGDRTEQLIWRIEHGQFGKLDPKAVVLMIGTNNTGHKDIAAESPLDTVLGIKKVIACLLERCPNAKIIYHPIFPRGATTNDALRVRNDLVNQAVASYLEGMKFDRVLVCDFNSRLLEKDGTLTKEMAADLLHPGAHGYEIWAESLRPYLDYALGFSAERPGPAAEPAPTALDTVSPIAYRPAIKQMWITDLFTYRRKGPNWKPYPRLAQKLDAVRSNPDHCYDVVMVGDSITQRFETNDGKDEWKRIAKRYKALNLGFGGDGCQNVLWNMIYGGFFDNFQARVITLMIGVNNGKSSEEDVAEGIRRCVAEIRKRQPQATLLLHPILPRRSQNPETAEARRNRINELVRPVADGSHVVLVDLSPIFQNVSDKRLKELLPDGVHPNSEAYSMWREAIEPYLARIIPASASAEKICTSEGAGDGVR